MNIARLLKDGSFVEHDRAHHLTSQCVRLVTDHPLPVNLNGEIATATPTDFTVQRNAVQRCGTSKQHQRAVRRAPRAGRPLESRIP